MPIQFPARERCIPVLFGLGIAGVYRLCASKLSGKTLKAHVTGLVIASLSGIHLFENPKINKTRFCLPLIVGALTLCWSKEFRKNGSRLLVTTIIQMLGINFFIYNTIHKKKRSISFSYGSDWPIEKIKEKIRKGEQVADSFAYTRDREVFLEDLDRYKSLVTKRFSKRPGLQETAQTIGKSITDISKRINTLSSLANRVSLGETKELLDYCASIATSDEQRRWIDNAKVKICEHPSSSTADLDKAEIIGKSITDISKRSSVLISLANRGSLEKAEKLLDYCASIATSNLQRQRVDNAKVTICKHPSSSTADLDKAEIIGKSITDISKRISALTFLAQHDPTKARKFLEYCTDIATSPDQLAILQFLIHKEDKPSIGRVLIPPKELDYTGLSQDQWNRVQGVISQVLEISRKFSRATVRYHKSLGERFLQVISGQTTHNIKIPFKMRLLTRETSVIGFLLTRKKNIGRGTERKVKLVYNLNIGEYWAQKSVNPLEFDFLQLITNSPKVGLPKIVESEKTRKGVKIYQPFFKYNIEEAIDLGLFKSRKVKLCAIGNILKAFRNLHQLTFSGLQYTPRKSNYFAGGSSEAASSSSTSTNIAPLPVLHGDAKPANIVINPDTLEIMLIDFGLSFQIHTICGTPLYIDPTTCNYIQASQEERIKYHLESGQKRDVWSTGLIIAGILFGLENKIPKLSFIQTCFTKREIYPVLKPKERVTRNIRNLTQETIDVCLDDIGQKKEPLIPLLKKMLRAAAKERVTMDQAFEEFRSLSPSYFYL